MERNTHSWGLATERLFRVVAQGMWRFIKITHIYKKVVMMAINRRKARPPFSLGTWGHCPQVIFILACDFGRNITYILPYIDISV